MKHLLVLHRKYRYKAESLNRLLSEKLLGKTVVVSGELADLVFYLVAGKVTAKIYGKDITDFDLVWLRTVGKEFFPLAKTLVLVLEDLKIAYFDTSWGQGGMGENKLTDLARLAMVGLPIPPTFFCTHNKILEETEKIAAKFGFPLVAKDIWKDRGRGVFLLEKIQDFQELLRKTAKDSQFLFQKFYANDGDYRILVLGKEVGVWEKRTRKKGEFRNNIALGGEEKFLPLEKIPSKMAEIAISAAGNLNLQIAGVDVLVEKKTDKMWLLEVNHAPCFTYDVKISPEIQAVASFLSKVLKINLS
jgi:glutathione synthase/RimK-type ligase-like ATP-grasp enzyme